MRPRHLPRNKKGQRTRGKGEELLPLTPYPLQQNIPYDIAEHIRQAEVSAGIPIRQFLVVDTELMEDRRVKIVNRHAVLYGAKTEIIGRPIGHAPLDAATSHEHRETVRV